MSDWACSLCEEQLCEGSRLNTLAMDTFVYRYDLAGFPKMVKLRGRFDENDRVEMSDLFAHLSLAVRQMNPQTRCHDAQIYRSVHLHHSRRAFKARCSPKEPRCRTSYFDFMYL